MMPLSENLIAQQINPDITIVRSFAIATEIYIELNIQAKEVDQTIKWNKTKMLKQTSTK